MKPYITHPETAEPFVSAEYAQISETAIYAEDITSMIVNGQLYVSLLEVIEWHEESIGDKHLIDFLTRALTGIQKGEWHPDN